MQELNEDIAKKVLTTVDAGLCKGIGHPIPGEMCVEAAVCYAYGLPHSDSPPCVGSQVRSFKIVLNDCDWSSDAARAKGMRKLAIAQLGSNQVDQNKFCELLWKETARQILPLVLNYLLTNEETKAYQPQLEELKKSLQSEPTPTEDNINKISTLCWNIYYFSIINDSTISVALYHLSHSVRWMLAPSGGAALADIAIYVSRIVSADNHDSILQLAADIALQALKDLNSPGCQYLYLCE